MLPEAATAWADGWVATAPTPARAHGTLAPAANMAVCTATPSSPVCGSRATIEYVTVSPPDPAGCGQNDSVPLAAILPTSRCASCWSEQLPPGLRVNRARSLTAAVKLPAAPANCPVPPRG